MKNTITLSLISAALLSQLNAAELIKLSPIAITSTAIATDELKSTDAVEVYTQEDIEKAHVQNVYEFLNTQTSITAMPSYGNPYTQLVDLHGYGTSNGNKNVVITLNGRKLNNIDNVPQLLSAISPASISRIEIIKGSGIVVGGDGANAGVINITTKKNNDKSVSFYMGSYGLADGAFYLGHSDDTLSISASGEAQKSDGIRKINAAGDKDKNKFSTGTFNLAYTPIKELELRFGASYADVDVIYSGYLSKAQYDKSPKQQGNYTTHQAFNTDTLSVGTTYFVNDNISIKADASRERKESKYIPTTTLSNYDYNFATLALDLDYDFFNLTAGVDAFNGTLVSGNDTTSKDNLAGFIMSEFYLGHTTLKAGYRYEKVSYEYAAPSTNLTQDNSLNGVELGINQVLTQESSVFLNYAHAYQAPNIDTFFKTDYSNWPTITKAFNQFIDPMKSDTITLGYNNITPRNKFKISIYYIDLTDEIYLHKPDYKNTNLDKSHKYGLDFYDKFIINKEFNVALNYNYVQAIIDEEKEGTDDYSNKYLPGVSDHSAKATLNYLPNEYATFTLSQIFRSEAYAADDFNNNFSQKQEAFYSTNISATYAKDNWEIFAKINNLFNQSNGLWIQNDAIYPINFTTTAMAGLKLKF